MCPVVMHINVTDPLCVAVAPDMVPFFKDKTFLTLFCRLMGEDAAVKTGTDNDIIVLFHNILVSEKFNIEPSCHHINHTVELLKPQRPPFVMFAPILDIIDMNDFIIGIQARVEIIPAY